MAYSIETVINATLVPLLERTPFDPAESRLGLGLLLAAAFLFHVGLSAVVAIALVAPVFVALYIGFELGAALYGSLIGLGMFAGVVLALLGIDQK